jgi:hypothetical protein
MTTETPQDFFKKFVLRAFNEFRSSAADEYLAKTAVHHANVLAERVWHRYKDTNTAKVLGAKDVSEFRDLLAASECADFALVRDVDDGFKHLVLNRKSRRVTSADQVGFEPTVWNRFFWNSARWGGQIVIRADDGTQWDLLDVLQNVVQMWSRLLAQC